MSDQIVKALIIDRDDGQVLSAQAAPRRFAEARVLWSNAGCLGDALDKVARYEFDIIFLAFELPDSTGLDTLQKILDACGDTPVVALIESEDEFLALSALQSGAEDYINREELDPVNLRGSFEIALTHAQTRQRNTQSSMHDEKTEVGNRSMLDARWSSAMSRAREAEGWGALMVVGSPTIARLDRDHGPGTREQALRAMAQRIRTVLHDGATVARLDDDCFAVLLEDLDQPATARQLGVRITDAIEADPISLRTGVRIVVDFGLAPIHAGDREDLALALARAHEDLNRRREQRHLAATAFAGA